MDETKEDKSAIMETFGKAALEIAQGTVAVAKIRVPSPARGSPSRPPGHPLSVLSN